MSYYDQRIKKIAEKTYTKMPLFGMGIRIIILLFILMAGRVACELCIDIADKDANEVIQTPEKDTTNFFDKIIELMR